MKQEQNKSSFDIVELVDFRISEIINSNGDIYEGIYGINVSKVQEIIQMPEIFEVPASNNYVVGVFDLRGTIIPLIDLASWLGIKQREVQIDELKKRVIITEFNELQIGFVVHDAKLIRRISWSDIEIAHFSTSSLNKENKITGVTRIEDGKTLLILDLESIADDLGLCENEGIKLNENSFNKFSGNVLIVDDSSTARNLLSKNLKDMGFDVIVAYDGEVGINILEQIYLDNKNVHEYIEFIISDIEMPRIGGFKFAETIKNDDRFNKIPIIFNSSICDKFIEEQSLKVGATDYIVKFNINLMYEKIEKLMKQKNR